MGSYNELQGKAVIVTGAGGGIGEAIARRFAQEGACVAICDIIEKNAQRVAVSIQDSGGSAFAFRVDVTQYKEVEHMVQETVNQFGRLDILVNNAGVAVLETLIEASEQTWNYQMDVNAKGVFICMQVAAKQMLKQGHGGRIITNASGAGKGSPGMGLPLGVYAATKHATVGLTKALADELAGDGILVNCVCAGIVDTQMWDLIDEKVSALRGVPRGSVRETYVNSIPLGRIQKPEDVANVIVFLASNESSYMTGQAVNVTGGLIKH